MLEAATPVLMAILKFFSRIQFVSIYGLLIFQYSTVNGHQGRRGAACSRRNPVRPNIHRLGKKLVCYTPIICSVSKRLQAFYRDVDWQII